MPKAHYFAEWICKQAINLILFLLRSAAKLLLIPAETKSFCQLDVYRNAYYLHGDVLPLWLFVLQPATSSKANMTWGMKSYSYQIKSCYSQIASNKFCQVIYWQTFNTHRSKRISKSREGKAGHIWALVLGRSRSDSLVPSLIKVHLWGIIPFDNETLCVSLTLPGVILHSFANSQVVWKLCGSGVNRIAFL